MALRLVIGGVALFLTLLVSCTLQTFPRTVSLRLQLPAIATAAPRGPALASMKCFGVIIDGAPGRVTPSQLGERSPSCLKMSGAFFGPYTYAEITGGISLALSAASYNFSVVGFDGSEACGSTVSSLFQRPTPAETYAISAITPANLATDSSVSLSAAPYVPGTATNLTASCPPETYDCSGAIVCDRFIAADGSALSLHQRDDNGYWASNHLASATIQSNAAELTSSTHDGVRGFAIAGTGLFPNRFKAAIRSGEASLNYQVGLFFRYADPSNVMVAGIKRVTASTTCRLFLAEVFLGSEVELAALNINRDTDCDASTFSMLEVINDNSNFIVNYRGYQLNVDHPSPLAGTGSGVWVAEQGTITPSKGTAAFFRADEMLR